MTDYFFSFGSRRNRRLNVLRTETQGLCPGRSALRKSAVLVPEMMASSGRRPLLVRATTPANAEAGDPGRSYGRVSGVWSRVSESETGRKPPLRRRRAFYRSAGAWFLFPVPLIRHGSFGGLNPAAMGPAAVRPPSRARKPGLGLNVFMDEAGARCRRVTDDE